MRTRRLILAAVLVLCGWISLLDAGYTTLYNVALSARAQVVAYYALSGVPIIHTPFNKVNIVNDQIVLRVSVSGLSPFTNIDLFYRVRNTTSYNLINFSPSIDTNTSNYSGEAIIPANHVTISGLEYYILAQGPHFSTNFQTSSDPQVIEYMEQESLRYTRDNNIINLVDGNTYDGDTRLTINDYPDNSTVVFRQVVDINDLPKNYNKYALNSTPAMVYRIEPMNSILQNYARLDLLYLDINQDGREDNIGVDEGTLKIYWFDNYEWRYIGGQADTSQNTVWANIYNFGVFGLFSSLTADEKAYKPLERIITPNNDGINDTLLFSGLNGVFEIKILDINGRLVRTITEVPYWDGKDTDKRDVPGGVYFYQLKVNNKMIKGTFVVAR